MEYIQFKCLLIEVHGVNIVGWPTDMLFANPSKITRIGDLHILHATWFQGTCRWVRLTVEEQEARKADNQRRLTAGKDPYTPHGGEKAKSASKKRKPSADDNEVAPAKKGENAKGKEKGKAKGKVKSKKIASSEAITEDQVQAGQ
jgi:hypothetical protein